MIKTAEKINRMNKQFSEIAGEPVQVEEIKGAYYVFGSELATLRIFKKYHELKNVRQGFSENMNTFYFRIVI